MEEVQYSIPFAYIHTEQRRRLRVSFICDTIYSHGVRHGFGFLGQTGFTTNDQWAARVGLA
jgi:hypothetical protein